MEPLGHGRVLGRFRLRDKLAQGGMAEIWSADDLEAGPNAAPIALKLLRAHLVREPQFRAMFMDELRISALLKHPNIVTVLEAHDVDGHLFQSMELIDGQDLRRILSMLVRARRAFPLALALSVAQKLARALGYAHERRGADGAPLRIVHRDVSPHNVMVSRAGQVKLLDFGIARAAERLARTRTGVVKGKLSYMAPEQALAVGVTPQTDIFATGVVLWEMLAMRRLFVAEDDAALVDRVVQAEVPAIRSVNREVPEDVAQLLAQMLAQRAPNRPSSMRVVEQGLSRALARLDDDVSESRLAMWLAELLGSSGPKPLPAVEHAHTEPTTVVGDSPGEVTTPHELPGSGAAEPTPETPRVSLEDPSTDPVRLPTHSEIVRAVENQPTLPVRAAAPSASALDPDLALSAEAPPTEPEQRAPWLSEGLAAERPTVQEQPWAPVSVPVVASVPEPDGIEGRATGIERRSRGRLLPMVTLILAVLVVVLALLLVVQRR